jgi:hypothetical protein
MDPSLIPAETPHCAPRMGLTWLGRGDRGPLRHPAVDAGPKFRRERCDVAEAVAASADGAIRPGYVDQVVLRPDLMVRMLPVMVDMRTCL